MSMDTFHQTRTGPEPAQYRFDRLLVDFGVERANRLVRNVARGIDDVGFGDTVDAPIDGDPTRNVGARPDIRVAVGIKPAFGIVRSILVVEPVDRNGLAGSQLHEEGMLLAAGHAPGSEYVNKGDLAAKLGT